MDCHRAIGPGANMELLRAKDVSFSLRLIRSLLRFGSLCSGVSASCSLARECSLPAGRCCSSPCCNRASPTDSLPEEDSRLACCAGRIRDVRRGRSASANCPIDSPVEFRGRLDSESSAVRSPVVFPTATFRCSTSGRLLASHATACRHRSLAAWARTNTRSRLWLAPTDDAVTKSGLSIL